MRGLCPRLCLLAAALGLCGGSRNCPDLIVDRCLCAAERSKGPGRPALRIKVVCTGGDLVETLQPAVLPNRTVSL
ncbi:adhesion G protein-coupled receptor A2-like [Turdus rufiventris]|nr:adhesion G protein-coupled receptor A2-like [Turdus rufiventris]